MTRIRGHFALYGQVRLRREYCGQCDCLAFVVDGCFTCCGIAANGPDPIKERRISDCALGRRGPSNKWRQMILQKQEYRCFYCDGQFGSRIWRWTRIVRVKLVWDHVNPYVFSLDNRDQNFVAACQTCNGIKRDYVFDSYEAAKTFILARRKEKGYASVPRVRQDVRRPPRMAKIL